jgi:hypothetical protein
MDVEGHILGILWIMTFGKQLDEMCFENAKGNRLRTKLIWNDDDVPHNSPALFEPYFAQYSLWRDGGLTCAENLLEKKHDVLIVTLDLKKLRNAVKFTKKPVKINCLRIILSTIILATDEEMIQLVSRQKSAMRHLSRYLQMKYNHQKQSILTSKPSTE